MKGPTDVLLINPPFTRPDEPVISIGALSAWLRSKRVDVEARDLSLELFRRTVTISRMTEERSYAEERFRALNGRETLDFRGMYEYMRLFPLLLCLPHLTGLFDDRGGGLWDRLGALDGTLRQRALELATASAFPDFTLQAGPPVFNWSSPRDHFSQHDIMASTGDKAWYSETLAGIVADCLSGEKPLIAAISISYYNQIIPAFQCAALIRRLAPDLHISIGGAAAQIFLRDVNGKELFTFVDSIATGHGEMTLEALSRELKREAPSLEAVPGIIYLSESGVIRNDPSPPLRCESLPCPDYTVLPLHEYIARLGDIRFPLRLSQGCSWGRCTFCRTELAMIREYQMPPVERLFPMIEEFVSATGCRKLHFADETIDLEALEEISKMIKASSLFLDWNFQTRIDGKLTERRCRLFREAGCTGISFGVESLSDRVLGLMRKGISSKLTESVINEAGGVLPVTVFMMVGFPGETEEEARESHGRVREMMRKGLIREYIYSPFVIHSGSEMMADPDRFGITGMRRAPGPDLSPDIIDYHCTGMAREKVWELLTEFSRSRRGEQKWPAAIEAGGKIVRRRFDIEKMMDIVSRETFMRPAAPLHTIFKTSEASIASEPV
jgi:hypothetical protein